MGWIVGKGIGVPFRLGGSGLGSSYWATRKPSNLVALASSATVIGLTWSDAASAGDGLRIYISTDNSTFTEHGTASFGDESYTLTGLTKGTTYYFQLVAYKGTNESDALTDFETTPILLSDVANQIFWYDSVSVTNEEGSADIATDLSGQSGNIQAPGSANRPAIVADSLNGYPALSFDGSSDRLVKTDAPERTLPYTVFAVVKFADYNADSGVIGGTTSPYSCAIYMMTTAGNRIGMYSGSFLYPQTQILDTALIIKSIVNGASSSFRLGGNEITGKGGTNTLKGLNWGGYANGDGTCAKFLGYEVVGYSGELSLINQVNIAKALGIKYNISEKQVFDRVFHNSFEYNETSHVRSAQSEFRFMYSGTTLQVKANPSIAGIDANIADIGIFVNGVFNQVIEYSGGSDTAYKSITLPAGYKEVRIIEGPVSCPTPGTYYGTYITDIIADLSFKKIPVTDVPEKIAFLGDSITVGTLATDICKESFARLFYVEDQKEVTVLGWGYNRLEYMASDAEKLAITVGYMTSVFSNATTTKKLVIMLGINDYSQDTTAETFSGWYADLLDAIQLSDADIHIYCISPIRRLGDPALLASYRTEIETLCTARPSYTTYINGYALCDLTDLVDGVHPSTIGHRKIYDGIKSIIV